MKINYRAQILKLRFTSPFPSSLGHVHVQMTRFETSSGFCKRNFGFLKFLFFSFQLCYDLETLTRNHLKLSAEVRPDFLHRFWSIILSRVWNRIKIYTFFKEIRNLHGANERIFVKKYTEKWKHEKLAKKLLAIRQNGFRKH